MWKHSYKSINESNLWQDLSIYYQNASVGVREVMMTWTGQAGYPVVKIVRDYSNRSATVTQEAFIMDPEDEELTLEEGLSVTGRRDTRKWIIPLTYTNGGELDWSTNTDQWLKSISDEIVDLPDENTWFIANIKQVGYYRVNYDERNWEMLLLQLLDNHYVIHPINRAQIINDALTLARSENLNYGIALNMTKYLYHEEEYLPWQSAFTSFKYFDLMLSKTSSHKEWREYVLILMAPLYEKLGWTNATDDDSLLTKYLRKSILKWSCTYGLKDCVQTARQMFSDWRNGTTSNLTMAIDDREVVLCTGISEGTTEDWEYMWDRYHTETFKGEKNMFLKSLTCTKNIRLLEKLLAMVLSDDGVMDTEDGSDVIIYVAENIHGRDILYKFFKTNAEEILYRFSSFPFARSNVIDRLTASYNTKDEVEELESILKKRTIGYARKAVTTGLQRAKTNVYWMEHHLDKVVLWLKENSMLGISV